MRSFYSCLVCLPLFLFSINSNAQVGIGTTSPNAQLDIQASNQASPAATDGILIPKVDAFPTGVGVNQDAMLVYLTTTVGSDTPGFYYYYHATTDWLPIGGAKRLDDLIDVNAEMGGLNIYIGEGSGSIDPFNGDGNTALGRNTLMNNTFGGDFNVAIGNESSISLTQGSNNVTLGAYSLFSGENANNNIAIGRESMYNNVLGSLNIAIGTNSLRLNEASENIAIGHESMRNSTSGYNNISLGNYALYSNTLGTQNISVGRNNLYQNTIGDYNIAIGESGMHSNNTGSNNIALGNNAMSGHTISYDNIAIGTYALSGTGMMNFAYNDNVAIGISALSNTLGNYNVALGSLSSQNVLGNGNISMGYHSLMNNNGDYNIAFGFSSMSNSTNGYQNISIGYNSMINNDLGQLNVAIGSSTLYSNTHGTNNIAIGQNSSYQNTEGNSNVAVGDSSLSSNTTGSYNVAIGYGALPGVVIGNNNVALGSSAGVSTTGNLNVFLGSYAGYNSTGSNKLYIENSNAGPNSALIYGEFDNNILRTNSEFQIGNPGINGYSFPTIDGAINQVLQTDGSGNLTWQNITTSGDDLGNHNATTTLNLNSNQITEVSTVSTLPIQSYDKLRVWNNSSYAIGMYSGMTFGFLNDYAMTFTMNNDTDRGWIFRDVNDTPADGAMSLTTDGRMTLKSDLRVDTSTLTVDATNNRVGIGTTTPDYSLTVGGQLNLNQGVGTGVALRVNGSEALWYNGTYFSWGFGGTANYFADRIGIGTGTPAYQLQLNTNSAAKPTSSTWTVASDSRLKTKVRPFSDGLELINQINPVWFTYNGKAGMPNETGVGTIAQDLQKLAPYMVNEWEYQSEDGSIKENYLGVDYGAMDFILINAIKEQQEAIKALEDENSELKSRIDRLEAIVLKSQHLLVKQ